MSESERSSGISPRLYSRLAAISIVAIFVLNGMKARYYHPGFRPDELLPYFAFPFCFIIAIAPLRRISMTSRAIYALLQVVMLALVIVSDDLHDWSPHQEVRIGYTSTVALGYFVCFTILSQLVAVGLARWLT